MMISNPVVLLVDDSEDDALLMRIVFERVGFTHPLQFARDGEDAIAYLQGDGRYANRALFPLPSIVLMDLNMPRKNGFEMLEWMRGQEAFKRLHVYILSASNRQEDIDRAYALGANSYLLKPGNLDGLVLLAKGLFTWLKIGHFAAVR